MSITAKFLSGKGQKLIILLLIYSARILFCDQVPHENVLQFCLINWNPKYSPRAPKQPFPGPSGKSVKPDLAEGYMKTSHSRAVVQSSTELLLCLCRDSTQGISDFGRNSALGAMASAFLLSLCQGGVGKCGKLKEELVFFLLWYELLWVSRVSLCYKTFRFNQCLVSSTYKSLGFFHCLTFFASCSWKT